MFTLSGAPSTTSQIGAMPLFRRFFVPKVHCSEGSLVRRFVDPKVRCSEGSLLRRFVNPNLGTSFSEKISAADHTQARGRHVQILIKLGIAVHIVFVIVIITMVHVIISRPTSTSAICCRTPSINLSLVVFKEMQSYFCKLKSSVTVSGVGMFMSLFERNYKV